MCVSSCPRSFSDVGPANACLSLEGSGGVYLAGLATKKKRKKKEKGKKNHTDATLACVF
jgi:hypothetical protein